MMEFARYFLQSFSSLRRAKGFAFTIILTLGITSATLLTVLSIANAVYFNPLPYGDEERIFLVNQVSELDDYIMADQQSTNTLNHWYREQSSFEYFSPVFIFDVYLEDAEKQPLLSANFITSDYLEIFDVPLILGRGFSEEEDDFNTISSNILISEHTWQEHFSGSENIVGTTIRISGKPRQIIGVVAKSFKAPDILGGNKVGIWMPWSNVAGQASWTSTYQNRRAIGQIKSGIEAEEVENQLAQILMNLESEWKVDWPQLNSMSAQMINIREVELGKMQLLSTFLLLGALGLLIIATANTSNLFFTRTVEKTRINALKVIIGAKRKDLLKSILMETLMICFSAMFVGSVIAFVILQILPGVIQSDIPMLNEFSIDGIVLLSAVVIALVLTVIFSYTSIKTIDFTSLKSHIQSSGKGTMGGMSPEKMQVFVIAQIAIASIVLLGGSLFLGKALSNKTHELPFDTQGFYHLHAFAGYEALAQGRQEELENNIRKTLLARVDVQDVAISLVSPFLKDRYTRELTSMSDESLGIFPANFIDQNFLVATGVDILEGRNFTEQSGRNGQNEIIVSESVANKLGGGVVGNIIKAEGGTEFKVVGIVEDGYHPLHFDKDKGARVYFTKMSLGFPLAIKMTSGKLLDKLQAIELLQEIDSSIFIYEFHDVDAEVKNMQFIDGLLIVLISSLMLITLLLSAVGIIGLLSYNMKFREYEIGIRLAVGAQRKHIYSSVLVNLVKPIAFGIGGALLVVFSLLLIIPDNYSDYVLLSPILFSGLLAVILACCLFAILLPVYRLISTNPHLTLKGA